MNWFEPFDLSRVDMLRRVMTALWGEQDAPEGALGIEEWYCPQTLSDRAYHENVAEVCPNCPRCGAAV